MEESIMSIQQATFAMATTVALACGPVSGLHALDESPRLLLTGHLPALEQKDTIPGIERYELVEIECPTELEERIKLDVTIDGATRTLSLFRHSLRSPDFRLLVDDGDGLDEVVPPPHRTFRGSVSGLAGSSVRAALSNEGLGAKIELGEGRGTWWIQPLSTLDLRLADGHRISPSTHVLMTGVIGEFAEGHFCGNEIYEMAEPDTPADGGLADDVSGNRLIAIAACADYEFFQRNSSSVTDTLEDIERMINFYESIYEQDPADGGVNLNFEFSAAIVHSSSNDPYSSTSADGILCEFRTEWNSGEETSIRRDVAQMYTGKQVQGNTIGLAWVGVVCNRTGFDCGANGNLAYNMIESRYVNNFALRTALGSHELGHNLSATHCDSAGDCEIMCSSNGACGGTPNDFGSGSRASILNYINAFGCDTEVGDPIELPFLDEFDSVSSLVWNFNKGGTASTSGLNEPSPTRSLQLDATGSGEFDRDEVRTRSMNAFGFDPMYVSFHTQFRSLEAGEGLRVEYINNLGDWTLLDEIITPGSANESSFTFHEYEMGSDAKTNRFRLRFIALVNSSADDIYIDDLVVGGPSNPPADPPANDECDSAVLIVDEGTNFIDIEGATTSQVPGCEGLQNDVWYFFVTGVQGTATVTLCGSTSLDTGIALYSGFSGCPFSNSQLIACSDDSPECGDDPFVQFDTSAYPAVYIRIGSFSGDTTDQELPLTISIEPASEPCVGDLNDDGIVDGADLAAILGSWNTATGDLNGDGITDGADLSIVLGNWGPCP